MLAMNAMFILHAVKSKQTNERFTYTECPLQITTDKEPLMAGI